MAKLEGIDIDAIVEKIISRIRDEVLREILGDIVKALKKLINVVAELAVAQRETEKRLNELTKVVNSLVGEVARIRGEIIEDRVINDLAFALTKRGFDVYRHFPGVPYVDAVVETDGFLALIQICKKCDLRDVKQVIRGAQIFEEREGIKPSALVILSYTGEVPEDVLEEAKRKNIIVECNTRRLVRKLLDLAGGAKKV